MASQKKIIEMITLIKNLFPFYAKDSNVEMLVKTWDICLNEYPDNAVEVAFMNCLKVCKMPPSPAEIIEQIKNIAESTETTDEELWAVFTKALDDTERHIYSFNFTFVPFGSNKTQGTMAREAVEKIWENLPDRLKQYIGSKGELIRMSRDYSKEDLKFEKNRFLKEMPSIKKREEFSKVAVLLEGENSLLIGISE